MLQDKSSNFLRQREEPNFGFLQQWIKPPPPTTLHTMPSSHAFPTGAQNEVSHLEFNKSFFFFFSHPSWHYASEINTLRKSRVSSTAPLHFYYPCHMSENYFKLRQDGRRERWLAVSNWPREQDSSSELPIPAAKGSCQTRNTIEPGTILKHILILFFFKVWSNGLDLRLELQGTHSGCHPLAMHCFTGQDLFTATGGDTTVNYYIVVNLL